MGLPKINVVTTPAAPDTHTVELVADLRHTAETTGWVQEGLWLYGPRPVTNCLEELDTIAGLVAPKPTVMWLTSSHWAELAREIEAKYGKHPTPENFRALRVGCLEVRNSTTEDQGVVNAMNRLSASDAEFAQKRDALKRPRTT
ncbi:MAG: hypothetical protein V4510_13390 [bacterium]